MMRRIVSPWLVALVACTACGGSPSGDSQRKGDEGSRLRVEGSAPPPGQSRPLRQGFTQRPARDAPGLPPLPEPFLSESERAAALSARARQSERAREAAEKDLLGAMSAFAASGELAGLYEIAREHALAGRIEHMSANALYEIYLYPNDEDEANARYRERPVVLTGRVAPHNMTDAADGFKLFELTPYSHEPVLLETEQELVFVRCRLARPEIQKLRDWQEIHILGVVAGKERGDVVLDDCVVLPS